MKHFKCLLFFFTVFFITNAITAQDSYNPWGIGIGLNAVNNPVTDLSDPVTGLPLEAGRYKTWNMDPAGFRVTAARYLKYGFIFETVISLNTIKLNDENSDEEFPYISADGMVKYNLSSHILPVNTINPYVGVGGGYTWLDNLGAGTLNGTVGVNIWASNNFGFNIQSTGKKAFKDYGLSHFQHSVGVVFKFGGGDSDGDGIFNTEDECPKEFGLAKYNGCPDEDGDGIIDSLDGCPTVAGLAKFNGCPDTDDDGVIDNNDECPNAKGTIATRGCPDRDGDGVPDKYDRCPENVGPANNRGCPIQKVPVTKEDALKIDSFARTVLFNYGKDTLRDEDKASLDQIVPIMKTYKDAIFNIDGHTDDTSSSEHNLNLSQKRADAVKAYIVSKGIDPSRLYTKGYGETRPLVPNNSDENRKKNRRVEIILRN